jgi:hypothetical protein
MQHADGRRNWLIGRRFGTDTIMAWLVDTTFHSSPVFTKTFSPYPDYSSSSIAQLCKTSPSSEILFWCWGQKETRCNQLLKFNRQTGKFFGLIHLVDSVSLNSRHVENIFPVDAAFSPDGRYLYTVENSYKYPTDSLPGNQNFNRIFFTIRQYDLSIWDSASIKNSGKVVFQGGPFQTTGPNGVGSTTCQLGPDGKIYFLENNQTILSVMHCPGSAAPNVQFKFRQINLQRKGGLRMPTLNQTFVRNAGIFQLQANKRSICQSDTIELSGYGAGAERFQWSVSPAFPASVKLDTLTWQKIPTRQLAPGTYTFSCRAFSRCGDVFEKTISVEIKPIPSPTQPPRRGGVSTPCLGDSVFLFVPNPQQGYRYYWSNGDTTATIVVKESGNYSLDSVSNSFGCGIKVRDTVAVVIKNNLVPEVPVLASPQLVEVCAGVQSSKLKVQSTGSSVIWNTGQTGDSVLVSGAGKYWAIHQTEEGCTSGASDTINVVVEPLPVVQLVASDNGHCLGNEETKRYKVLSFNSKVKSLWSV